MTFSRLVIDSFLRWCWFSLGLWQARGACYFFSLAKNVAFGPWMYLSLGFWSSENIASPQGRSIPGSNEFSVPYSSPARKLNDFILEDQGSFAEKIAASFLFWFYFMVSYRYFMTLWILWLVLMSKESLFCEQKLMQPSQFFITRYSNVHKFRFISMSGFLFFYPIYHSVFRETQTRMYFCCQTGS